MYYNFRIGILGQWKKLLFVVLFVLGICAISNKNLLQAIPIIFGENFNSVKIGFLDYIFEIFKGERPVLTAAGQGSYYTLSTIVLLLWLLLSFCCGNFVIHELQTYSEIILTRVKSRYSWWNQKTVWNVSMVVVFYTLIHLTVFLFCFFSPSGDILAFEGILHPQVLSNEPILNGEFWIAVILVPLVSGIALTQMQITLSLLVGPFVSYILMLAYFVCCTYVSSPLLIGNGLMLIRNRLFVSSGISSQLMIVFSVCYWLISYVVGAVILNRYPIIKRKEGE